MLNWVSTLTKYLNKFLELGVVLLAVSVIAEVVFGPNVAFFGSQVTKNLINLLNSLGDAGIVGLIAAIIILNLFK